MMIESRNAEEFIEIALRISSDSRKLMEEDEVRSLVLDMQFYSNYFFTLGKSKWWMMSDEDVNRLADNFAENRKMGHDILDSIQDYQGDDPNNRVSVLEEKMAGWTEKVVEEYSLLLTAKPDESSQGYMSCRETVQFITIICCTATEMLRCGRYSEDNEKQKIYVSRANLRFLRGFVRLDEESEGMRSVLNCIQGYTRKVEVGLFLFWAGRRAMRRQNLLLRAERENDSPTSVWECILVCISTFINDCYSSDLLDYIRGLSLPVVGPELEGGIQLLHERLASMAHYLGDLSLDMRVLFIRAAASLGFFCIFSFRDSSEQMIEHAKFQLSIMTASMYMSIVEVSLMKHSIYEYVNWLKILRECLKDSEDGYLEEDNWAENNVNQILFVLDIVDMACSSVYREDMIGKKDLRRDQNYVDTQLLVAEQMLNVDSNNEMLRKGIRLLRMVITDLTTMEDSADENLRVSGKELVEDVIPLVYNETMETDDFVSDLLPKLISWETNVTSRYMQIRFRSSQSTHPRTDRLGFIDCLEDTLLSSSMPASSLWMKYQIRRALKGLKSCKSSLNDIAWDHDEDNELDNLVSRLTQAAYEVEYVSESFAIGDGNTWTKRLWISDLIDEIKQIMMKIEDVLANMSYNDDRPSGSGTSDRAFLQPVDNNTPITNELVVGMEEQEETVTNQLIRGSPKLGVVSIVGMGGLAMMIESRNAKEFIEIALHISSESRKLMEEEEEASFLVLDMQFYSNYFFTLGKNKWWMMSDEDVNRLADKFMENRKMGHDILDSIQDYHVDDPNNRVSALEEKMAVWTEKVVQEYSLLLTTKPDESYQGYISCKEMVRFITSICCTATEILRYTGDSEDNEKLKIYVSLANLRFLRGFVWLDEESEGMRSVLNCIQGYTRKVEVALFLFWAGRRATLFWRTRLLLERADRKNDSPTSVWECILECISKFVNDCNSNDLLDYLSELPLPNVGLELEDEIQLLDERLNLMAQYHRNLSLDMQVLFARAAASLGFFNVFSFRDSSEQVIEHAKFQILIMTTSLYISVIEVSLMEYYEFVKCLKILRDCLKDSEDGYLEDDNWAENNVNQILFVLDIVDVVTELEQLNSPVHVIEKMDLRRDQNYVDIQLLVAEKMLKVDSNIEMLRKGIRLVRIVLTDLTTEDLRSADENLRVSGNELVEDVIPLVSKLLNETTETDDFVSDLLPKLISWETNVTSRYMQIRRSTHSTHPRTDRLGFIDTLLSSSMSASSSWMKYQTRRALKDLKSCKSSLNDILWDHDEDSELDNLVSRLTQAAYEVAYVSKSFAVVGDGKTWTKRLWISDLIDEIKQTSMKIKDVLANKSYNDDRPSGSGTSDRVLPQPVDNNNNTPFTSEVVVGMEEEEETVTRQLIRGSPKLGVVSIVGMGGLGKTTLAKKVFNSPSVQRSFDVCAWCTVSKVYRKREALLEILGYVVEVTPEIRRMTDDDLSERLRQLLLRKSYLIIMDDMWDMLAWKEMQQSFPKDERRSRILFTSRINHIASESGYGLEPCSLDSLSDTQSWELLERKVFEGESCPLQLRNVGWVIATKCKGLPLAVVVISGLLRAKEINLDWWKQVAENLNSIVVGNSTNIIDLSYRYLPDYLKPCFLYFCAFKEDERVLVSSLIDLWSAEGFIRKTRKNYDKSINDVARNYLMELVTRNLVNIAERTSTGGIKACHVHDLLHELCRAKAEEESFLHVVKKDLDSTVKYEHRRVCIYSKRKYLVESRPSGQCVRSLLLFLEKEKGEIFPLFHYDGSFIALNFKLLRILKLDSINIGDSLSNGFELLVHLRFLAVLGEMKSIPDSIKRLSNLESFYVKGLRGEVELRDSIWKLKKLRNLRVRDRCSFSSIKESLVELDNLESLSTVFLPYGELTQNILQRVPRLHKLKCIFSESWNERTKTSQFPILESLNQLESLKVLYHGIVRHPSVFCFPATLKKLTLSKFRLPWKDISPIGALPCLEVLKLLFKAFEGQEWEMESEVSFQNLKYLKLESLDIVRWTTSYDSFPCLEKLVLQSCKKLEEVPFAFGESSTLQMIQVHWCSSSAAKSVKDIQDEQMDTSGRKLNVLIHPPDF